jgi:hypothetical protein
MPRRYNPPLARVTGRAYLTFSGGGRFTAGVELSATAARSWFGNSLIWACLIGLIYCTGAAG